MSNFGTDLDCLTDLRDDLGVAPTQGIALLQCLCRLLQGRLWYSPQRGIDVVAAIGASGVDLPSLRQRIALEIEQDERVRSCFVEELSQAEDELVLVIDVQTYAGPTYRLTGRIDQLTGEFTAFEPLPIRTPLNLART